MKSAEEHLSPEIPDDDSDSDSDAESAVDVDNDGGNVRIDERPDEDDDVVGLTAVGDKVPIGGKVTVGRKAHAATGAVIAEGKTWTRVADMGDDVRIAEEEIVPPPQFELKNCSVDDTTKELDLFWLLMPVTLDEMFDVLQFRAAEVNDKHGKHWCREHIVAHLLVLFGAAQFKKGTKYWSKEKVGVMPAPDFGQYITHDRFKRVGRYLARGPEGCDEMLSTDPWAQFRWLVDGFNETRRRELTPGKKLNPDESMFAWKGKSGVGGLPHLSFVKRKPEPLGLESKTVCDGESGVMLFMEMQEGTTRMARKDYVDDHQHTTAATMRLVEGCYPDDGKKRTVYIDSWFCSYKTQLALQEKFGCHTIGSVKTAHALFPAEAARWTLKDLDRGEHVVFKCDDEDVWCIAWSDVHFKLYLATCGESGPGESAAKKRQRSDGRNFSIQVDRPKAVAERATSVGNVDLHDRHRQGIAATASSVEDDHLAGPRAKRALRCVPCRCVFDRPAFDAEVEGSQRRIKVFRVDGRFAWAA